MAYYSRSDFAKLIGKQPNYVGVLIKRKNIVLSGEYIDDKQDKNKQWLLSYFQKFPDRGQGLPAHLKPVYTVPAPVKEEEKVLLESEAVISIPSPKEDPKPKAPVLQVINEDSTDEEVQAGLVSDAEIGDLSYIQLERQKLLQEILYKRTATKINEQRIEKQNGEVIPTEFVGELYGQHAKSIYSAFESEMNRILEIISQKHRISNKDMATYRGSVIKGINKAIDASIESTESRLDDIVATYSVKRGRGEKK